MNEKEQPQSDALVNYEMALRSAIMNGYLTEDEADMAMEAFIQYEFGDSFESFQQSLALEDNQRKTEDDLLYDLTHAVSEGWITQEQADDALYKFKHKDY